VFDKLLFSVSYLEVPIRFYWYNAQLRTGVFQSLSAPLLGDCYRPLSLTSARAPSGVPLLFVLVIYDRYIPKYLLLCAEETFFLSCLSLACL